MVLLLGACPEYGCLLYEYMANGSLDDCLFHGGGGPVIPCQHLHGGGDGLHQTKSELLVHCDLKPGKILMHRNYMSKISDVGLQLHRPHTFCNPCSWQMQNGFHSSSI